MKKISSFFYLLLFLSPFLLSGCDDKEPDRMPEADMYVSCQGLWGHNNASIFGYNLKNGTSYPNMVQVGDVANDLKLYKKRLYCVANGSEVVRVIDPVTNEEIAIIDIPSPRQIVFKGDYAYVTSFDGNIYKIHIDTYEKTSLRLDSGLEGICISNNKIYVAQWGDISGNYDNKVVVVDLTTFSKEAVITVNDNPQHIVSDEQGNVYVTSNGNYNTTSGMLQKITGETVVDICRKEVAGIAVKGNDLLYYTVDYFTNFPSVTGEIYKVDLQTGVESEFLSSGGTERVHYPYGIGFRENGDVYICDAVSFAEGVLGDVYCFDVNGGFKYKITDVGVGPNKVAFY